MSDARTAILITLDDAHEGGFQRDFNDRANWTGGKVGMGTLVGTNGGITALDLPGADIEHLTEDQKIDFYQHDTYWKPLYNGINSQPLANKIFDLGVLFGVGTVAINLQRILSLQVDGLFGEMTLMAVNAMDPAKLLEAFKAAMAAHAHHVALMNPEEASNLSDWLRRTYL